MLDVNIEKILPITAVRDALNKIIDEVEDSNELYVITKNGKPAAIIVGVHHLEKLTGISHQTIMPDETSEDDKASTSQIPSVSTSDQTQPMADSNDEQSVPLSQSPVAGSSELESSDFDDLFSNDEPTPMQPAAVTTPEAPVSTPVTNPTINNALPAQPITSTTDQVTPPQIQPQPLQAQPAASIPVSTMDNMQNTSPAPSAIPPTNSANLQQ